MWRSIAHSAPKVRTERTEERGRGRGKGKGKGDRNHPAYLLCMYVSLYVCKSVLCSARVLSDLYNVMKYVNHTHTNIHIQIPLSSFLFPLSSFLFPLLRALPLVLPSSFPLVPLLPSSHNSAHRRNEENTGGGEEEGNAGIGRRCRKRGQRRQQQQQQQQ